MSMNIYIKCLGYITFRVAEVKVLMLGFMEVQLKVNDMVTGICTLTILKDTLQRIKSLKTTHPNKHANNQI